MSNIVIPDIRVHMLKSVDSEHVAGVDYVLPAEVADAFILKGYALGAPSRPYTDDEIESVRDSNQVVSFS